MKSSGDGKRCYGMLVGFPVTREEYCWVWSTIGPD